MSRLKIDTVGRSTRYECEDMDAGLALHAHEPGSGLEHDVRCDAGCIVVFLYPHTVHVLREGERLDFDATLWHCIAPLTPGAVFTNTSGIEQAEFHSVLNSPHKAPAWLLNVTDSTSREASAALSSTSG